MVEHYLWTENRSETDHFVLHHCHRIQTVNSFWGLMLPFLSKAWLKFLVVGLGWLVQVEQNTGLLQVEKCWTFLISRFWPYMASIYTTVGEIGACLWVNLRDVWSSTAGGNLWVTKPRSSADWLVWSKWFGVIHFYGTFRSWINSKSLDSIPCVDWFF